MKKLVSILLLLVLLLFLTLPTMAESSLTTDLTSLSNHETSLQYEWNLAQSQSSSVVIDYNSVFTSDYTVKFMGLGMKRYYTTLLGNALSDNLSGYYIQIGVASLTIEGELFDSTMSGEYTVMEDFIGYKKIFDNGFTMDGGLNCFMNFSDLWLLTYHLNIGYTW